MPEYDPLIAPHYSHRDAGMAEVMRALLLEFLNTGDVELLRAKTLQVLPTPPADFDPRPYIAAHKWTYARTRPENPHYYLLMRESKDWRTHLVFVEWLRRTGQVELWNGMRFRYRTVNGWRYWALSAHDSILNRRRVGPEADTLFGERHDG